MMASKKTLHISKSMQIDGSRVTRSRQKAMRELLSAILRNIKKSQCLKPTIEELEDENTESEAESCCEDHANVTYSKEECDKRYFETNAE